MEESKRERSARVAFSQDIKTLRRLDRCGRWQM
jgi:hypothetical protein